MNSAIRSWSSGTIEAALSPRRGLAAEFGPVELAQLALDVPFVAVDAEEALGQLDCLLHRFGLDDGIAANHFLRLGERAVGARQLAAAQAYAHAFRGWTQAGRADKHAVARHLLDQLAHVLHQLLAWRLAAFLVDADHR